MARGAPAGEALRLVTRTNTSLARTTEPPSLTQTMTTLHVRIGSSPDRTDLEATLESLEEGDDVEAQEPTLTVEDLETFGRVFRPTNLELLAAIATQDPGSLRELARFVERHPPEVNDNVAELVDYGLVELERNGRAKRPIVRYDEIDVELPIGDRSLDGDAAPV